MNFLSLLMGTTVSSVLGLPSSSEDSSSTSTPSMMASTPMTPLSPRRVFQWSCLDDEHLRNRVRRAAAAVGAKLVEAPWLHETATHLLVGEGLVKTEKVLSAVARGIHVVGLAFADACVASDDDGVMPDAGEFDVAADGVCGGLRLLGLRERMENAACLSELRDVAVIFKDRIKYSSYER